MGRYYDGDIRGKFWFGVQPSDDADYFGVEGYQPNYLEYNFDTDNLPDIEQGVQNCLDNLGENKERLDKFFDSIEQGYNDKMVMEFWLKEYGITLEDEVDVYNMLKWYARLELGQKILDKVKETGACNFMAEL